MTRRIEWLHDGRIAQGPVGEDDGPYSDEEFATLSGLDYVNVHMRHFFLPTTQANLAFLREQFGVRSMLYVNMLHVPWIMDTLSHTYDREWAELHAPAITGHCAWRAQHGGPDLYWCDPTKIDPSDVADFILGHINRAQVAPDAIFLDHAIERPWLVDEGRSLGPDEFPIAEFQEWQKNFAPRLCAWALPPDEEFPVVFVNGSWPLDDHALWRDHADGKQWEALGSRWSRWEHMSLAKISQWSDSSMLQILDVRKHPAWTAQGAIARFMAATRDHILIRKGNVT